MAYAEKFYYFQQYSMGSDTQVRIGVTQAGSDDDDNNRICSFTEIHWNQNLAFEQDDEGVITDDPLKGHRSYNDIENMLQFLSSYSSEYSTWEVSSPEEFLHLAIRCPRLDTNLLNYPGYTGEVHRL